MFVLDTCAVSEIAKPDPDPGFWSWFEGVEQKETCVTATTVAELFYGLAKMPKGKRRDHLTLAVASYLNSLPVLDMTRETGELAGRLLAAQESTGRRMQFADASIAAVAIHNDAVLVTRDAHFDEIADQDGFEGFRLLDPWSGTAIKA